MLLYICTLHTVITCDDTPLEFTGKSFTVPILTLIMWVLTVYKAQTGLPTKRLLYTSVHILHIHIHMCRTLYVHKEFPLTNGTSISCGHNDSEGVIMFCECFQSNSNRSSVSDHRVCGRVEPHRNYRVKNEDQWNTCTTVKSQVNYVHYAAFLCGLPQIVAA